MNSVMANDLAKTVLQKKSIQDCSLNELQQLSSKYSYSATLQLLLTQKLQEENHSLYNEQLQKLSLYIQSSPWLEQLLEPRGNMIVLNTPKATEPVEVTVEKIDQPTPTPVEAIVVEETSLEIPEIKTELVEAPIQEIEQPVPNEAIVDEDSPIEIPEIKIEAVEAQVEKIVQPSPAPVETIAAEEPSIEIPETKTEPVVATTPELTFEPYHTVDYFASQGIRMRDEEIPKDKLGLQLKSFTEWLKTLKRLPATEINAVPISGSEKKVEQMAELSLTNPEVVTEAMAQVWEKQGNTEKAIATYRKLSLLDPSKSSYFAAKIEHLKTT